MSHPCFVSYVGVRPSVDGLDSACFLQLPYAAQTMTWAIIFCLEPPKWLAMNSAGNLCVGPGLLGFRPSLLGSWQGPGALDPRDGRGGPLAARGAVAELAAGLEAAAARRGCAALRAFGKLLHGFLFGGDPRNQEANPKSWLNFGLGFWFGFIKSRSA